MQVAWSEDKGARQVRLGRALGRMPCAYAEHTRNHISSCGAVEHLCTRAHFTIYYCFCMPMQTMEDVHVVELDGRIAEASKPGTPAATTPSSAADLPNQR